MDEASWGVVFPGISMPVLMLRADCSLFASGTNLVKAPLSEMRTTLVCAPLAHDFFLKSTSLTKSMPDSRYMSDHACFTSQLVRCSEMLPVRCEKFLTNNISLLKTTKRFYYKKRHI